LFELGPSGQAEVERAANASLARQSVGSVVGQGVAIAILLGTTTLSADHSPWLVGLAAWVVFVAAGRLLVARVFTRMYPVKPARWSSLFGLAQVLASATWGVVGAATLVSAGSNDESSLVLLCVAGVSTAGLTSLNASRTLLRVHIVCVLSPLLLAAPLLPGNGRHLVGFAVMVVVYAAFLWFQAGYAQAAFLQTMVSTTLVERQALELARQRDEVEAQATLIECQTEAATDGIFSMDDRGRVLRVNSAFREMWGVAEDRIRPGDEARKLGKLMGAKLVDPASFHRTIEVIASDPSATVREHLALTDGRVIRWANWPVRDEAGKNYGRLSYHSDVTRLVAAEREARASEARARAVIEGAHDAIVGIDDALRVVHFNGSAERTFGTSRGAVLGTPFMDLAVPADAREAFVAWLRGRARETGETGEWSDLSLLRASGKRFSAECAIARAEDGEGAPTTLFVRDVSVAKQLEAELRQAQKLESVGRLASGIAHEINTPVQFVGDSLEFVQESIPDLFRLLRAYQELLIPAARVDPEAAARAAELERAVDLEYLAENVPPALDRARDGIQRVATIVQGMKEFAHPSRREMAPTDLNRAIQTTLTVARNEYKYVADVETELGDLPLVTCNAGELNQAILNIVINAAHAIGDAAGSGGPRGRIGVRTWCDGRSAFISISDSGTGIPDAIRERVFEPFFTTKSVGRGTGQGLAITRSVVVDKHRGDLTFDSKLGAGTTFVIRLPVRPSPSGRAGGVAAEHDGGPSKTAQVETSGAV
jgi:PAS domain S-box-containing protein